MHPEGELINVGKKRELIVALAGPNRYFAQNIIHRLRCFTPQAYASAGTPSAHASTLEQIPSSLYDEIVTRSRVGSGSDTYATIEGYQAASRPAR